jgi:hypothetical protein
MNLKATPEAQSIRHTLFGDERVEIWACPTNSGGSWASFADARAALDQGKR